MGNPRAYYIWCDESEKHGVFYSNFYGGILIRSCDYLKVMKILQDTVANLKIDDEIKWQKVNEFHFEAYKKIVDVIFDLLKDDLIKIRIFFRHNKNVSTVDSKEWKQDEYLKLYYQFIKHSFGLQYSNSGTRKIQIHLSLDDIPMDGEPKEDFKQFLVKLSNDPEFLAAKIEIKRENISEVNSHNCIPLQMLDLILGSMDFRLNNKHKSKIPGQRVRGKRTILKEKLYKYINSKIRELYPGFNIGVSTSYSSLSERWTDSYRHWSFVPALSYVDNSLTKRNSTSNGN